jgi:hypothetical protein
MPKMLMEVKRALLLRLIRLVTLMCALGTARATMEAGALVPKDVVGAQERKRSMLKCSQWEEEPRVRVTSKRIATRTPAL